MKSFVYRATRPFNPAKLEDFLGAVVQVYGPRMLRYKGVLDMQGTDRKVIFQGVHQLMGSDLGPAWAEGEERVSKMVFIGLDLPRDILVQGLDQALGLIRSFLLARLDETRSVPVCRASPTVAPIALCSLSARVPVAIVTIAAQVGRPESGRPLPLPGGLAPVIRARVANGV